MNFWQKIKNSISELSYGENANDEEKTLLKQQRAAKLNEVEKALIILSAEIIKASKNYPKSSETFLQNFFNLHFGYIGNTKRISFLNEHLEGKAGPYTKMSCTQIKALSTSESIDEMVQFLIDLAVSDSFLNQRETKLLRQIAAYLGQAPNVTNTLLSKALAQSNPYAVLGISENASEQEVLKAYRKKILIYHPDSSTLPISEEEKTSQFLKVKKAFEQLTKVTDEN
jgi:curved DNA-binding protein CbpA